MALLFADSFNRSDRNLSGDNSWTASEGNASISSNAAIDGNASGADMAFAQTGIVWPNDYYVQAELTVVGGGAGGGLGAGFTFRGDGAGHFYRIVVGAGGSGGVIEVASFNPGYSVIWQRDPAVAPWPAGAALRVEMEGTTLRVFQNGVQVGADSVDATLATGRAGIAGSAPYTSGKWDNFEAGTITTGPCRTGATTIVDASAGSGSTTVTVPGDATGVIAFASYWNSSPSADLGNLTLGGITLTEQLEQNSGLSTNGYRIGSLFSLPGTGSQTFAWTWVAGAPIDEGGYIVLVWVKNLKAGDELRDVDGASAAGSTAISLTLDTQPNDLLLQFAQSITPTLPGADGIAFINDQALNSHIFDISEVTPSGGSTTTLNMTNEDESVMLAASLKATTEVAGPTYIGARRRIFGVG